jgi:hypothetical protein
MSDIASSLVRVSLAATPVASHLAICNVAVQHWRNLMKQIFHPYRPELHYMRGPGPKWHAKHAAKIVHD